MSMNRKNRLTNTVAAVLLVVMGFVLGTTVLSLTATETAQVANLMVSNQPVSLSEIEQVYADVYETVSPSVVAINVGLSSGSGFVIDTEGHIVTNYHVVQGGGANEILVNFLDGTIVRADVVGTDLDSDLAVIRVDAPAGDLIPVTFGSSEELIVGQQVLAIGSPFNQRWTMTAGIISALDRAIQGFTNFRIGGVIQTDAPINPGNSGGPLLNLRGEVIGVNSQISSETRSNSGIGYAVPSDLTVRVARELIETGTVNYSYIGIGGDDLLLTQAETLRLPNNLRGIVVERIEPGGPAEEAGLRAGRALSQTQIDVTTADIITAVDGQPLKEFNDLISYLAKYTVPGDTVTFTVIRGGQTIEVPVTLGARPRAGVQ